MSFDELAGFELFSGHFDKYNIDLIPTPKRVFTFVREPRSRIISLYNFWRAVDDGDIEKQRLRGPWLAKNLTFLEFLQSEELAVRHGFDNVMARTLLGRDNLLDYGPGSRLPVKFVANWAFSNLKRYNFVGVMEKSEQDFQFLFKLLDLTYTPNIIRNVGPRVDRNLLSGKDARLIAKEIDRLTAIDQILYDKIIARGTRVMCSFPL